MRKLGIAAVGVITLLAAPTTASADVQLTIAGGRVTLVARNATVRQILAEWARVGQTKIINAERVPGGPLTLELVDVPERQALETLLSAISGYLAAPRAPETLAGSQFDRIIVMPTNVAPAPPVTNAPPPAPTFTPPFAQQTPNPNDDQDEDRPQQVVMPGQNRGFTFQPPQQPGNPFPGNPGNPFLANPANQVPQPQPVQTPTSGIAVMPQPAPGGNLSPPTPATAYPGAPTTSAPAGVAVPGMIVPTPAPQPGQPLVVFPGQPPRTQDR